jgi:hypothetical protein
MIEDEIFETKLMSNFAEKSEKKTSKGDIVQ